MAIADESTTHAAGKCEIYKEERDTLEEGMRKIEGCDMEKFGTLDSSEEMIALLGDRWWPQTAKEEGYETSGRVLCNMWKKRTEHPNVGGVSIRSRNGAPSRKGCVVNGQITKASNKCAHTPSSPSIFTQKAPYPSVVNRSCSSLLHPAPAPAPLPPPPAYCNFPRPY